jgi:hypothetical protein
MSYRGNKCKEIRSGASQEPTSRKLRDTALSHTASLDFPNARVCSHPWPPYFPAGASLPRPLPGRAAPPSLSRLLPMRKRSQSSTPRIYTGTLCPPKPTPAYQMSAASLVARQASAAGGSRILTLSSSMSAISTKAPPYPTKTKAASSSIYWQTSATIPGHSATTTLIGARKCC